MPVREDLHLAACTIAAKRYLSAARVLAESFRGHHPGIPFFVLLADEVEGCFAPEREPFHLLRLSDLSIPDLRHFCFAHAQQPLTYAATPYLLSCLLDRQFSRVVFLKQESLVLGELTPAFEQLARCSILLTAHLLAPLDGAGCVGRELNILQSGVFNVGFLGVSETPVTRGFLAWWQDRLYSHCRHAVALGLHYEQRWLDLVPALFEDVQVVRDPGLNVGHWNLPERGVEVRDGAVEVDGQPCRLFRFSGFDPDQPVAVTRHSGRLNLPSLGPARQLFERYSSALAAAGYHETRRWPYAYEQFDNDVPIPDVAREVYREFWEGTAPSEGTRAGAVERFGDPFAVAPPHSFYRWLNQPIARAGPQPGGLDERSDESRMVTRLWEAVYRRRPDVQRAFPDFTGADHDAFLDWTISSGGREHAIAESFFPGGAP